MENNTWDDSGNSFVMFTFEYIFVCEHNLGIGNLKITTFNCYNPLYLT